MATQVFTSVPGLDSLTRVDTTQTSTSGTGDLETLAEFIVPRGEARKFLRQAGRLTLGAKQAFDGTGAATTFTLSKTIANSPRAFKVPAKLLIGGVEKTYVTSAAPAAGEFTVLFATNEVKTGDVAPVGVGNVVVYYPPVNGDGRYSIEVFNPTGRRRESYGNGTLRRLNTAPQDDINSPWTMSETPWIVQDYIVRIQVSSTGGLNVDAANPFTQIELPFIRKGMKLVSKEELAALVQVLGN